MAEPSLPFDEYYTVCPNNIKIGLWGENEGAPNFDVGQFVSYITEVNVYEGNDVVDGLQIGYVDVSGQKHTLSAGNVGGESKGFKLKSDERINQVRGYCKGFDKKMRISQLEFRTDSGNKYGPYGPGGGQQFIVKVKNGIIGFFGQSDCKHINSIGFYLADVGKTVSVNLD